MSLQSLGWLTETPVAAWINSSAYIWPLLECIHFASLCVLFGSLLVVDLRLIGFYREPSAPMIEFLVKLSLLAFALNLATGLLFFTGNTYKYIDNPAFELKMVLILAAGINAVYYRIYLSPLVGTDRISRGSVTAGWLSLGLWTGVIICGRMITFYAR